MGTLRLCLVEGDLTALKVDAIVNPANSLGVMGGGVAGAIRKNGGEVIEKEAMQKAPIPVGQAIPTSPGTLPCRFVIHAPTMERPTERTTLERVKRATLAALWCAEEIGLQQIAFPGMGTGVGRVDPVEAASAMVEVARSFQPKHLKEVVFVSLGEELKQAFQKALSSSDLHV